MVYDDKLAQAAYLIGCQRTGEAIVIDPERDIDRYESVAKANGLRIIAAAETHIHADFLSGAREFAEKGAIVYLSDEGDADWKYQWLDKRAAGGAYNHRLLKDGDTFAIGAIEFTVVHTPGHTPEHICFMITDKGGGADQPIGIATGDFVFVGDLGRPDLLETAAGIQGNADPAAHSLYRSVQRFLKWPDYLQVWPAHGAGSACGKSLGSVPTSTVGYEKLFNASINAADTEQHFVDYILDGQPEPPLYFARMKLDNKAGPPILGALPTPAKRSAADMAATTSASKSATSTIIDTRPWAAFKAGHIPGSLYIPLGNSFSTDAGALIAASDAITIIVHPAHVDEAVRALIRVGLDSIVGWFDPADFGQLTAAGITLTTSPEITVDQARARIDTGDPFILDVRRRTEFDEGHIPGATNISHTRLRDRLADLPKDKPILVNCLSGGRSARACSLLQKHGYDATNIAGGITAWDAAHAPAAR